MNRLHYIGLSAAFAALLTAAVVIVPGYYESFSLLIGQITLIFCPILLPFMVLVVAAKRSRVAWIACAVLSVIGWGYVVYIDTRPYEGGGASFAIFFGWMTSVALTCFAGLSLLDGRARDAADPAWQSRRWDDSK